MKTKIETKTNAELEDIIKKGMKACKILKKKIDEMLTVLRRYEDGKASLEWLLYNTKIELGRRKSKACGVMVRKWSSMSPFFICKAKDTKYCSEIEMWANCGRCKLTPSQAKVQATMLRIKNENKMKYSK